MTTCGATMRSMDTPGHVHTCGVEHESVDHKCSVAGCRRWFYLNEACRACSEGVPEYLAGCTCRQIEEE